MTHPLIEAVARALSEAVDACAATGTHTLPDMLMDPDIIARAAVLATLRGLREPSAAVADKLDGWGPIRRAWVSGIDAAITEIGGPDA